MDDFISGRRKRRITNDLADYGSRIDATFDASSVAGVQTDRVFNVWEATQTDLSTVRQLTFDDVPVIEVTPAPDGKLVTASSEGELRLLDPDGSHGSSMPDLRSAIDPVSCDRFLFFVSFEPERKGLVRIDSDGSNPTLLAKGAISAPVCSADRKSVFYLDIGAPMKIFKVPIAGGTPTTVALGVSFESRLAASPDGNWLAYAFMDYTPDPIMSMAVVPLAGGTAQVIRVPGWIYEHGCLRWSPDGKSLQALVTRDGVTNIWEKPLKGGEPRQLTKFRSGLVTDFQWSADHKRLLLIRGNVTSDVVLFSSTSR